MSIPKYFLLPALVYLDDDGWDHAHSCYFSETGVYCGSSEFLLNPEEKTHTQMNAWSILSNTLSTKDLFCGREEDQCRKMKILTNVYGEISFHVMLLTCTSSPQYLFFLFFISMVEYLNHVSWWSRWEIYIYVYVLEVYRSLHEYKFKILSKNDALP